MGTKEKILITALRLFAQDGYEAVSVSRIAGELGMTKGALYKHYKNKLDIYDSIVAHIFQLDAERAKTSKVPEKTFDETPLPFRYTTVEGLKTFMEAQFRYWSEDETACNFRRMLTLEQYRNPELTELYHRAFTSGPLGYTEDLFREMMGRGLWHKGNPRQMAVEFYAPFYLLLSISDAALSEPEKRATAELFTAHVEGFIEKYASDGEEAADGGDHKS